MLCSLIVLLSACSENSTPRSKFDSSIEEQDLVAKITTNDFHLDNTSGTNYSIHSKISLSQESDADRIVYEVAIDATKITMNDLVVSFSLDPKIMQDFNTFSLFTSSGGNDRAIDIDSNGPSKSAIHSRAYIIEKNKLDSKFKEYYKNIYVKITYTNNGKRTSQYYNIQGVPSSQLEKYINMYIR
ncbi:hypothetical protein ACM1RC_01700 [Paenibacillus azoreducens]|uniref:hypothetical protein n=1 Tax=Paenibacillus azoreducens TaxID=116718 RepID=UPI0039F45890